MKVTDIKKLQHSSFRLNPVAAAIALALASQFSANVALANAGFGPNTDVSGRQIAVPTYYANSPQGVQVALDPVTHLPVLDSVGNPMTVAGVLASYGNNVAAAIAAGKLVDTGTALRKFVKPLPGVYNGLEGDGIPVGIAEKWVDGNGNKTNDDYYEFAIVEYDLKMHPDLPKATRLRGYVQIETPAIAAGLKDITGVVGSEHIPATYPDGTPIYKWKQDPATGVWAQSTEQVYFVHAPNYLGPAIVAAMGTPARFTYYNYLPYTAADGTKVGDPRGGEMPIPVDELIAGGGPVTDANGNPVIDPVTNKPMKFTQNRVAIHWHGGDSPWISDGTPHQWIAPAGEVNAWAAGIGKGVSAQNVPDMPDPGPGAGTLYFPNNLSGRLMMYHDHVSGLTKVNAYMGEAAGYIVYDLTELSMVAKAIGVNLTLPTGASLAAAVPLLDSVGIPLVIQDKTFVPKNVGPNPTNAAGLPVQSQDAKWDLNHWGQPGDLFFPHVYETNQDPNSADGTNPVGRWDWGPWFWPVFPAQYSLPSGEYGHATATPEAFMDTPTVNGQAYPTLTVDPRTYRFRILSIGNDRTQNLGLYQAVDANGVVCNARNINPAIAAPAPGQTGALAACTEVRMVPALPTAGFPATWPTDGRVGGVPDPATAGPDIVQIGSEGGLLPAPAIWKSQPVTYEQNVRSITMLNVLNHDLLLGGGERADVLIDFSKYAGQTLIVYNDAPAPMPGYDPRIDYYTGIGDQSAVGGAYDTLPGYGPNTRTVMQIKVNNTAPAAALDTAALAVALPKAYAATQPSPIIPETAYNAPFATVNGNNYAQIGTGSNSIPLFSYTETVNGVTTTKQLPVINKAIQELFDPIYGRMNATLAVELPFSTATVATTIPLAYIDVPVERLDAIKDGETQIWKITHNGVDSHPVHFHMVNVQVINRVGWDGTIKPPEANEVGWKETLRMNPLEDVYVAVKGNRPVTPFGVPASKRLLDPSQAVDSQLGFTQIDPTTGQAPTYQTQIVNGLTTDFPTTTYSNKVTDFDNEYVWHCHILGHEEQDFMRPFVFHPKVVVPDAPAGVTVTGNTVSWTDTTPFGGQDAQGIPTAGTNAAYPKPTNSPKNEIGFKVQESTDAGLTYTTIATVPANVTSWTGANSSYSYRIVAYNAAGDSVAGTPTTTTTAGGLVGTGTVTPPGVFTLTGSMSGAIVTVADTTGLLVGASVTGGGFPPGTTITKIVDGVTFWTSAPSATPGATAVLTVTNNVAAPGLTAAAGPTGLTQTLNANGSVTLNWVAVPGATGYVVSVNGGAATFTTQGTRTRYTVPAASLNAGGNNTFSVTAQTLSGATAGSATTVYAGPAYPPVAFAAIPGTAPGTVTLSWANDARNVNNVTGLTLTWKQGTAVVSKIFAPKTTGATVINLTSGTSYGFSLVANSRNGNSMPAAPVTTTAP